MDKNKTKPFKLQFDPSVFPKEPAFITNRECFLKRIKKEVRK